MADFSQDADAQRAIHTAAFEHLATLFTPRTVYRWQAYLRGSRDPHAARNPARSFAKLDPIRIDVIADYSAQGKEKYKREDKSLWTELNKPGAFFEAALVNPDEAWQILFESNYYPTGTVENAEVYIT